MSRSSKFFSAKLAISSLFLLVVLRTVDFSLLWQVIAAMQIGLLLLSLALFYPSQFFNAYRWYYLLRSLGNTARYVAVVRYNLLGQFSALFLPGQISSDIVRTVAISREQQDYTTSLLSVVVEKTTMLFAMTLFVLVGALASPVLASLVGLRLVTCAMSLLAMAGVIVGARYRDPRLLNWLIARPWPLLIVNQLQRLVTLFAAPRLGLRTILIAIMYACAVQVLNSIGSFLMARSMHITITMLDWAAINALVALIQILPITIAGIGVREGSFALLLSFYGISQAQSVAYGLTAFVLMAMMVSLGWFVAEAIHTLSRGMQDQPEPPAI